MDSSVHHNQPANPAYSGEAIPNQNLISDVQNAIGQALANQTAAFDAKLQSRDEIILKLMSKLDTMSVRPDPPSDTVTSKPSTSKKKKM